MLNCDDKSLFSTKTPPAEIGKKWWCSIDKLYFKDSNPSNLEDKCKKVIEKVRINEGTIHLLELR